MKRAGVALMLLAACSGQVDGPRTDAGLTDGAAPSGDSAVPLDDASSGDDAAAPPDLAPDLAPALEPCSETQGSDLPGLTRQCRATIYWPYRCALSHSTGCAWAGPTTELYNVYGLTPWFGNYVGPVTINQGQVSVSDQSLELFGAKWHFIHSMAYSGDAQGVCFDDANKYISLRFIANGSPGRQIQLAVNDSYLIASRVSLSTEPGLFDAANPKVLDPQLGNNVLTSTASATPAADEVQLGKVYYINMTSFGRDPDNSPGQIMKCPSGLGAAFTAYLSTYQ